MPRICLPVLLCLFFFACKQDPPPAAAPARPALTNEEKLAMIDPPPAECALLTPEEIQRVLPVKVAFPMPGQRMVTSFYSCLYDVEGSDWGGQISIDAPRDRAGRQAIIDEVAGARGENALTVAGANARFSDDGRSISVVGSRPLRITFAAISRSQQTVVWTEEEMRKMLPQLAELAL